MFVKSIQLNSDPLFSLQSSIWTYDLRGVLLVVNNKEGTQIRKAIALLRKWSW